MAADTGFRPPATDPATSMPGCYLPDHATAWPTLIVNAPRNEFYGDADRITFRAAGNTSFCSLGFAWLPLTVSRFADARSSPRWHVTYTVTVPLHGGSDRTPPTTAEPRRFTQVRWDSTGAIHVLPHV